MHLCISNLKKTISDRGSVAFVYATTKLYWFRPPRRHSFISHYLRERYRKAFSEEPLTCFTLRVDTTSAGRNCYSLYYFTDPMFQNFYHNSFDRITFHLQRSMLCSRRTSNSPPGRTGITHLLTILIRSRWGKVRNFWSVTFYGTYLGFDISSSSLFNFAVGKESMHSWSVSGLFEAAASSEGATAGAGPSDPASVPPALGAWGPEGTSSPSSLPTVIPEHQMWPQLSLQERTAHPLCTPLKLLLRIAKEHDLVRKTTGKCQNSFSITQLCLGENPGMV